jgi:uncharacterized DUF497 family protein
MQLRYQRILDHMDFEWDEAKSSRNLRERGFGFDFAALIFEARVLEARDDRAEYGEDRIVAIGEADGIVMTVVYTDRQNGRRIISARLANKKERQIWQSFANR